MIIKISNSQIFILSKLSNYFTIFLKSTGSISPIPAGLNSKVELLNLVPLREVVV